MIIQRFSRLASRIYREVSSIPLRTAAELRVGIGETSRYRTIKLCSHQNYAIGGYAPTSELN